MRACVQMHVSKGCGETQSCLLVGDPGVEGGRGKNKSLGRHVLDGEKNSAKSVCSANNPGGVSSACTYGRRTSAYHVSSYLHIPDARASQETQSGDSVSIEGDATCLLCGR